MGYGMRGAARFSLALVVAAALGACQSNQAQQQTAKPPPRPLSPVVQAKPQPVKPVEPIRTGPRRIALLAPLSGKFSDAGRDLANGAAAALFDASGAEAEIIAFDTRGDLEGAKAALAEAVKAQADVVIGPLFGANASSLDLDLQAAKLTALAFSNDGAAAGPNVLIVGQSVETEAARIIEHARNAGVRTVAVFGKNDAVGAAVARQAARESGATPGLGIRPALYEPGADYTSVARSVQNLVQRANGGYAPSEPAQRLKNQLDASADPATTLADIGLSRGGGERDVFMQLSIFYRSMTASGTTRPEAVNTVVKRYDSALGGGGFGADAVLLTVTGAELSTIAPMFELYDAREKGVRLLGLSGWAAMDPARARELHGGRFPLPAYNEDFATRYERLFGAFPSELAAVAYDATRLALAANERSTARPVPRTAFETLGTVQGANGTVEIGPGGLALRPMEVVEMQAAGLVAIEPARAVAPAAPPPVTLTPPGQQPPVVLTQPPPRAAGS